MRIVHALFDSYADATRAVRALEAHGIRSEDISIVAGKSDPADADKPAAEGAEIGTDLGALAGGAGGLLAGLGVVALPGIGEVLGAGWLMSTALGFVAGAATGLAVGGIAGALINAGLPEDHAHLYAEGIRHGGTLVTARVGDNDIQVAEHALEEVKGVDVVARRIEQAKAGTHGGGEPPT